MAGYDAYGRRIAARRPNLFNDPPRQLTPGKRYRIALEGSVSPQGHFFSDEGVMIGALDARRIAARFERLPDPAPEWKAGDVIVFTPFPGSISYTYVRGARNWPGDRAAAKTDEQVTAWWRAGKARPVLQAGGVPFDESRLK